MNDLIHAIKTTINAHTHLPFAVYSSLKEQRIFNVPIIKPVLIVVLGGEKRLGKDAKDQTKLGYGLHLLQTSADLIGTIAELCGYQSQSRFSERFKQRFGLTPSELRKTKLHESGEHLAVFE